MSMKEHIHPKLLTPGFIVHAHPNERVLWSATVERLERMTPAMLSIKKEREDREAKDQAV